MDRSDFILWKHTRDDYFFISAVKVVEISAGVETNCLDEAQPL